jgi:hypothetical protein
MNDDIAPKALKAKFVTHTIIVAKIQNSKKAVKLFDAKVFAELK